MLLFQSIFIYTLFALLLYIVSKKGNTNKTLYNKQFNNFFSLPRKYWGCIFIFSLFSGIRYDVGVDHTSYLENYIDAINGQWLIRERGIEEGYYLITMLCSQLYIHPVIYFGFLAAIQLYFLLLAMRDEEQATTYMLVTLVLGGAYLMWMNGIRQIVAAAIFVVAAIQIPQGKLKTFLLLLLFAYTWHHSVIILVPLYLLKYDRLIWNKRWINLIILAICIIIGNIPSWIGLMTRLGGLLDFIGYDYYVERLSDLTDLDKMSSHLFGPRKLIQLACNIMIIILYPIVRVAFQDSSKIDIFFKLSFIGMCLFYLFDNTLVVFRRPIEYFTIFILPLIGYTLHYLKSKKGKEISYIMMLFFSCSFLYLQCYIENKKPKIERQSTLYRTYWCDENRYQLRAPNDIL